MITGSNKITNKKVYIGLDIGSSKITMVAAQFDDNNAIRVIGYDRVKCSGLKRGIINNINEVEKDIMSLIDNLKRIAGLDSIVDVITNISNRHMRCMNNDGVASIRGGQITEEDRNRAIECVKSIKLDSSMDILHTEIQYYKVDRGEKENNNVVGILEARRLDVYAHLILCNSNSVKTTAKCLEGKLGLNPKMIVSSSLATSMAVTENFKRSQCCIVIDIGAQLCDIIVYIKGYIVYSAVLPMGGDDATQELANIINNSPSEAEEIKLKYGCVFLQMVDEDEKIKISNKQEESYSKRITLATVLADKYREIFNNIKNEINEEKIIDFGISGNISVVLTGGGSLISGAAKLATEVFGYTAELQKPAVNTALDMNDLVDSPVYSTVIGLILFAKKRDVFKDSPESIQVNPVDNKSVGLFQGLLNILKKIFFG